MANQKVTGTIIIRVDGRSIRTKPGSAKMMMGGKEREPQMADDEIVGYSEKVVPATVSATLVHTSISNLTAIRDATDVTILFEADSGLSYTLNNMFCTKPPELADGGAGADVEFAGQPATEG